MRNNLLIIRNENNLLNLLNIKPMKKIYAIRNEKGKLSYI